jgi:hypothetical protein
MKRNPLPSCGVSREKDVWAEGLLGSSVCVCVCVYKTRRLLISFLPRAHITCFHRFSETWLFLSKRNLSISFFVKDDIV